MDQQRFGNRVSNPNGHYRAKLSVTTQGSTEGAVTGAAKRAHE
jgi:hypothetical protein